MVNFMPQQVLCSKNVCQTSWVLHPSWTIVEFCHGKQISRGAQVSLLVLIMTCFMENVYEKITDLWLSFNQSSTHVLGTTNLHKSIVFGSIWKTRPSYINGQTDIATQSSSFIIFGRPPPPPRDHISSTLHRYHYLIIIVSFGDNYISEFLSICYVNTL